MQNPFVSCANARMIPREALLASRVNRDAEVAACIDALVKKRTNILIHGARGIGKTFLLRLIEEELGGYKDLFPAYVNASALYSLGKEDPVSSFSRLVLLQLCTSLWKDLLGLKYLDLRETLNDTEGDITLKSRETKVVQRIYAHLMTQQREQQYQMLNTAGVNFGVKGEKQEQITYHRQQSDVLPFEFIEFADELMSQVLEPKKKKRVIILCDEANLMPLFFQHEILARHLELFSYQRLQFVFVAGFVEGADITLPDCFDADLPLKGFSKIEHLREFITKTNSSDTSVADHALVTLFERFDGHPRTSIEACWQAFALAEQCGATEITLNTMEQACSRVAREIEERMKMYRERQKTANNRIESDK